MRRSVRRTYVSDHTGDGLRRGTGCHARPCRGAGQRDSRRRAYQEHDAATRTTFTATTDAAGNAVLTLKGGDFVLEKVVAHTGDATLRLSQGKDVVTIALSQSGFQVARGQKAVRVDPRSDKEDKIDAVRSVLLGSQAVRSFKRLVASLEDRDESEEDGPLALSALVDGAIVQLLDGDAEAARRIAKRITRKQRAGLRAVKARRAPATFVDCIGSYEFALMSAMDSVRDVLCRRDRVLLVEQKPRLSSCATGNGQSDRSSTCGSSSAASCFRGRNP